MRVGALLALDDCQDCERFIPATKKIEFTTDSEADVD